MHPKLPGKILLPLRLGPGTKAVKFSQNSFASRWAAVLVLVSAASRRFADQRMRKATMSDQDRPMGSSGVSRRGFLKGISVTSVATGLLAPGAAQAAAAQA